MSEQTPSLYWVSLSQGIHYYQGIKDWEEFSSQFDGEAKDYFELTRSYRSTMEIIDFANGVIAKSGVNVPLAVPVFRSGEEVKVIEVALKNRLDAIIRSVKDMLSSNWNTVAVIGRTAAECKIIYDALGGAGLAPSIIEAGQQKYAGGLSVVPRWVAKGLEFDAVLIADADEHHYSLTAADSKLLYVGCTRALHKLEIHYSINISPLINK